MNWYVKALTEGYDDKNIIQTIYFNGLVKFFMNYDKEYKILKFLIPQIFYYTPQQKIGRPDHNVCFNFETEVIIPGG